jgi:hypothetical protein
VVIEVAEEGELFPARAHAHNRVAGGLARRGDHRDAQHDLVLIADEIEQPKALDQPEVQRQGRAGLLAGRIALPVAPR